MGLNVGRVATLSKSKLVGLICIVYLLALAVVAAQPLSAQGLPTIRVNAGGGAYTDANGDEWEADNYYNTGQAGATTANDIANTDDDTLYQSEHWTWETHQGPLEYSFDVPDGEYEVKLHFAEIYGPASQEGARVFDVDIQDQNVLDDLDIYTEAGANAALVKTFDAESSDSEVTVKFHNASANSPKVSAIEVIGKNPSLPIRINAGGDEYTDTQGREWQADDYFNTGQSGATTSDDIAGTDDDTLYQSEHWTWEEQQGPLTYQFPVADGEYQVVLHFAEIYEPTSQTGERVFDVSVQDNLVLDDLDIFSEVGDKTALTKSFTAQVSGDMLNVTLHNATSNSPKISAIEVIPQLPVEKISGTTTESQTWTNDKVWYISNTVEVPDGVTLNIEEGTIVKIAQNVSGFNVQQGGALNAIGTATGQVIFTSYKDDSVGGDSNGDGLSTGAPDDYDVAISEDGSTVNVAYSLIRYGGSAFMTTCSGGESITLTDNVLNSSVGLLNCQQESVELKRNVFDVENDYPVYVWGGDAHPNIVELTGSERNTFIGSGKSKALNIRGNVEIPSGSSWSVDNSGGLEVLYVNNSNDGIEVNGTLNIAGDTIVKIGDSGSNNGITVGPEGSLNVAGSSASPVIFTSYKDDSVGGDSNGDGPSSAAVGDYGTAIVSDDGTSIIIEHATMQNGSTSIQANCSNNTGTTTLSDSVLGNSVGLSGCAVSSVRLLRNHFEVIDNYPIYVAGSTAQIDDASVPLIGPDRNTFSGAGKSTSLHVSFRTEIPVGSTWTLDDDGGLEVLYIANSKYGLTVQGSFDLRAGAVVKASGTNSNGITVGPEGAVNANGTSTDPVTFTSYRDDSIGGDSNGDGMSTGQPTDYWMTIESAGAVSLEHAVLRFGRTGLHVNENGQADAVNTTISDARIGLSVFGNALASYRGSFNNIENKAISSCAWDDEYNDCFVDAAYVDWGSEDGPFVSGGNLACGRVLVNPWVYNGAESYNDSSWAVDDCDDSPAGFSEQLSSNATDYDTLMAAYNQACNDEEIQDACDAADRLLTCMESAVQTIGEISPFPIPDSPSDWGSAFSGQVVEAAGAYLRHIGSTVGEILPIVGAVKESIDTYDALNAHYQTCFQE